MKPLTKRQVKILVLSIFGTVLLVVFVVVLVYFRLKDDKHSTGVQDGVAGQQQGPKGKPGTADPAVAEREPQDKKDNQSRPLKTPGFIQEAEEGDQKNGSESEPNTMKAKNSRSTDQKVTTVNNEASTAKPLISDQPGNATELGKNNSGTESSGKIGKEEKQLTTEAKNEKQENETEVQSSQSAAASTKSGTESSVKANEEEMKQLTTELFTTEALSTMNSQQVDDLIAKSTVVTANTPAEMHTANNNLALRSLAKKVKQEYASDTNAQAWMNSGFKMQKNEDFKKLLSFHLALPKDDKKRAEFKEILKLASDAAKSRAGMNEERGKYEECEDDIVEATVAEYLQLKVMTDSESSMDTHKVCMSVLKSIVRRTDAIVFGSYTLKDKDGAAVSEGFQIMKSIASEVIKYEEHHEYFLRCMKKNPGVTVIKGPDDHNAWPGCQ